MQFHYTCILLLLATFSQSARGNVEDAYVIIEGKGKGITKRGTGFLAKIDNIAYVITNSHVVRDCTFLRVIDVDGRELLESTRLEFVLDKARNRDLVRLRLRLQKGGKAFFTIAKERKDFATGTEVLIRGNAFGEGIFVETEGKILGIGPERIEVNAKFVSGHSGAPIVNLSNGHVVGVATYVAPVIPQDITDSMAWAEIQKNSSRSNYRWMGIRIDTMQRANWQPINWQRYARMISYADEFDRFTAAFANLIGVAGEIESGAKAWNQSLPKVDWRGEKRLFQFFKSNKSIFGKRLFEQAFALSKQDLLRFRKNSSSVNPLAENRFSTALVLRQGVHAEYSRRISPCQSCRGAGKITQRIGSLESKISACSRCAGIGLQYRSCTYCRTYMSSYSAHGYYNYPSYNAYGSTECKHCRGSGILFGGRLDFRP